MKQRVLVVIPAHNEEQNLAQVLASIKEQLKGADILVVDDCSTDDTAQVARRHGAECITNIFNLGYAMAVQTGIKYAAANHYDYVIQMDADGQHLAAEAKKLLDAARQNKADIIIGTRYFKGSAYKAPFLRKIGTKLFSGMIKLFCRQKVTDPLSGFQCLNQRVIKHYAIPGNYPEYPDANLIIEMLARGFRISEVPVKMALRTSGTSMHSGVFKPAKYMSTQFYACIIIFIKNIGKGKVK